MSLLRRLARAVVLAFGTIFALKGEGSSHWSDPPDLIVSAEEAEQDAGSSDPV